MSRCRLVVVAVLVGSFASAAVGEPPAAVPVEIRDVHVSIKPGPAWSEVQRYHPSVSLRFYESDSVELGENDVLVILFEEKVPARFGRHLALVLSETHPRRVVLFTRAIERLLGLPLVDTKGQIAIGRLIAHELEHVRRQSAEHDKRGFFTACVDRAALVAAMKQ